MFQELNDKFTESVCNIEELIYSDNTLTIFLERYDDNDYEFIQKKFFFFYQYINYVHRYSITFKNVTSFEVLNDQGIGSYFLESIFIEDGNISIQFIEVCSILLHLTEKPQFSFSDLGRVKGNKTFSFLSYDEN